jgi:hypothetical protein
MLACPDCSTSRLVRASVLDDRFWTNVAALALPLLVLALISVLLHRIGEPRGRGTAEEVSHD